jgi:hypothetical protein
VKLNFKKHRGIFLTLILVVVILLVMIAIGYPLGILSESPDGLERVLIDHNGEPWLENLVSPWIPLLSWIENNYIAAIVGVCLSAIVIFAFFKIVSHYKKRQKGDTAQS